MGVKDESAFLCVSFTENEELWTVQMKEVQKKSDSS